MAVACLSKLTVPLPAGQNSLNQGLLMPKLKYRFRVLFLNFGVSSPSTELTKQVISVARPTITYEDITLDVYNSKIKLAGKHSWEDITLKLRDDASNAVARLVDEQMQKQVDFYEQASAASGSDYKFGMIIEMLDGGNGAFEPVVLESWELAGCYLKSANHGDLDYATSDAATIELSVRFDNACHYDGQGNPIGLNVGRTVRTLATG